MEVQSTPSRITLLSSMIRQIATVSTGTLSSRLLGFLRDALIASLLGTGIAADAFLFAFQLVNVVRRLVAEGAFNAALVPAYLRVREQRGVAAATAFAGHTLVAVGLILLGASGLLALIMPGLVAVLAPGFAGSASGVLAVGAARLMLPYLAFVGPVVVLSGLLNARGQVTFSAFSPLLFNLALIVVTVLLLGAVPVAPDRAALILAATVGLAGLLQALVLLFPGAQIARPLRLTHDPEVVQLLRRALPATLAQSSPQLLLVAGAIAASLKPGSLATVYFASRLIELPLGIIGVVTGAVFITRLAEHRHRGEDNLATRSRALELGTGLAVPAAIALAILARPVVEILFQHGVFSADDTARTADALMMLAAALPAHALTKLLGPGFFAREAPRWPLIATLGGVTVTVVATAALADGVHESAVAFAIALGAWASAAVLAVRLAFDGGLAVDQDAQKHLPLILVASLGMGLVLLAAGAVTPTTISWGTRLALLAAQIGFGLASYIALLRVLRVISLKGIHRAFRSR